MALSPRMHAALALVLGLAVLGSLLTLLVLPVWHARATFWEQKATLANQAARYQRLAAQTPALKQQVTHLLAQSADRSGFLPETSQALAAAALQRKLQTLVESHGGRMQSVQNVPATAEGPFQKVTVRVQAALSLDVLGPLFRALASDTQLLETDQVFMQTRYSGGARAAGEGVNLLEVRFDVSGYLFEVETP